MTSEQPADLTPNIPGLCPRLHPGHSSQEIATFSAAVIVAVQPPNYEQSQPQDGGQALGRESLRGCRHPGGIQPQLAAGTI